MALDPTIASGIKVPAPPDPLQMAVRAGALANLANENRLFAARTALGAAVLVDPERPVGERARGVDQDGVIVAPAGERGTGSQRRAKRADHEPAAGVRGLRGLDLS